LSLIMSRMLRVGLTAGFLCALLACTSGPRKSEAERQTDKETAERVQEALAADNELYSRHIYVRADSGVVKLSGFVWEPPDIELAQRIAG
jgi:osmotically-inducible protein OsmY